MQKTLEILKSEDGLIIKKLSHKKIVLLYKVPLFFCGEYIPFDYLNIKLRYSHNGYNIIVPMGDPDYVDNFIILNPEKLKNKLSQKMSIKMVNIEIKYLLNNILYLSKPFDVFNSIILDKMISGIYFNNLIFKRNYNINKIFEYDNS